jgi:hypothetical protein
VVGDEVEAGERIRLPGERAPFRIFGDDPFGAVEAAQRNARLLAERERAFVGADDAPELGGELRPALDVGGGLPDAIRRGSDVDGVGHEHGS